VVVLHAPVAKLLTRQAGAGQQDFFATHQGVGHVAEQGAQVDPFALVFVVTARANALGFHMRFVEHGDMGFGVIDPDNGVKSRH
jgi:hypothetical protein